MDFFYVCMYIEGFLPVLFYFFSPSHSPMPKASFDFKEQEKAQRKMSI
jgi:hypothetical protein